MVTNKSAFLYTLYCGEYGTGIYVWLKIGEK